MRPLIMDARPLLDEYGAYAPLFAFYQGGLKDLIREAVVTRSFNSPFTTQYHLGHRHPKGLAAKVATDFEFALDHHHDLFGEEGAMPLFNMDSALFNLDAIRFVADAIEDEVDQFLFYHLRTRLFEIAQEGSGEQFLPRWSGRDLLIYIRSLSQKECRSWFPFPDLS
jgi:hypothetical protein